MPLATPHTRGSTLIDLAWEIILDGYPAYAGIDPCHMYAIVYVGWLPRIRGDRPPCKYPLDVPSRATPHTRGSTRGKPIGKNTLYGYPAYAGIDPPTVTSHRKLPGLPRIRGDRPMLYYIIGEEVLATPHTRGST